MTNQKDPVCGMDVNKQNAANQSEYQDQKYYFCSESCKQKFDQNPQQYAGSTAQAQRGGSNR